MKPIDIQRQQAHLRRCRKDVVFQLARLTLTADEKAALLSELCRVNCELRRKERERVELIALLSDQAAAVEWVCELLGTEVRG